MANYHNEINKIIEKILYKMVIQDKSGMKLEGRNLGLSFLDIYMIKTIGFNEGLSIYNLAKKMEVDRRFLTSNINKLVLSGYIEKERAIDDKRVYELMLTDLGSSTFKNILEAQNDILDFILNDITLNEEKAVLKFLSKVNQKIK